MGKQRLRRSLFIGLGGTGIRTILKTKALFVNQFEEVPPMLAFLGVDTDEYMFSLQETTYTNDSVELSLRESCFIGVQNPREYYNHYKHEMKWMPVTNLTDLPSSALNKISVLRSSAQLAFMYHREHLKNLLRTVIFDICQSTLDDSENVVDVIGDDYGLGRIEVHIVFSLCGGTGSGIFLDMAYLLREIALEMCMDITLNGYAVMPGVFIQGIMTPPEKSRFFKNTYAALRELDYYMCLPSCEHPVKLPGMQTDTCIPPFDSVSLIDNEISENVCLKSLSELTDTLSNALMLFTEIGYNMSIGDIIKRDIIMNVFDIEDKKAWVTAMGISSVVFNGKSVAKVYALKMQNKIISQLLSESEDVKDLANNWINNVRIAEHEKDDVIDHLYDMSQIAGFNITDKDFDRRNVEQKINNKVEQYYTAFEPSNSDWEKTVEDFFAMVSTRLTEKVKELANEYKSIGLANEFLKEVKSQIENIFLQEMIEEQKQWEADKQNTDAELQSRIENLRIYLSKGMFHSKTKNYLTDICSNVQDCLTARIEVKHRAYAQSFYSLLIGYLNKETAQVEENVRKLSAIKDNNDLEIQQIKNRCGKNHVVEFDLTDERLRKIEASEREIPLSEFIYLLPTQSIYDNNSQETLKKALEQYTFSLKQYKTILSEDIDTMLDSMSANDFENVARRAFNRSKPLLQITDGGYKISYGMPVGIEEMFYICVPDVKTNRLTRGEYYTEIISADHANVVPTGLHDRIIIYRQKRPIPAFAIKDLELMSSEYERNNLYSYYIDEQLEQTMKEEHFSLYPHSISRDKGLEAWVIGCMLGFVKFEESVYMYYNDTQESRDEQKKHWVSTQTPFRDKAYELFRTNQNVIENYLEEFERRMVELGVAAVDEFYANVKNNYIAQYSRCPLTMEMINNSLYLKTKELIEEEMHVIDKVFYNI
ncbi:MAG: hypothetical protein IJ776_05370 [Paludibacteraceae bacterium]|nr:hypothetical protein [Paludibacteraceae bacterium]